MTLYATVETKCGVRQILIIICVTYVQKNFYIRTSIKKLFLTKVPQISHVRKYHNFSKIIGTF